MTFIFEERKRDRDSKLAAQLREEDNRRWWATFHVQPRLEDIRALEAATADCYYALLLAPIRVRSNTEFEAKAEDKYFAFQRAAALAKIHLDEKTRADITLLSEAFAGVLTPVRDIIQGKVTQDNNVNHELQDKFTKMTTCADIVFDDLVPYLNPPVFETITPKTQPGV